MRSIHWFFALLAGTLLIMSCVKQQDSSGMITESRALALAKKQFVKNGFDVTDYLVSVETDGNGQKWIVWFDRKGKYSVPGGKHAVTVEKATGKVIFMPGE